MKIMKAFLWIFLIVVLLFFTIVVLVAKYSYPSDEYKEEEVGAPVATVEYSKPTEEFPGGSIEKYSYRYGSLAIDRGFSGYRSLKPHRLFAEIYTSWPEFGKRKQYLKSDENKRLRIMFEIDKSGTATPRDLYDQYSDNLNPYGIEDNRFPGFVGYKQRNGWIYMAEDSDLVMPQGTQVVITCSDDESFAYLSSRSVGHCSYHFVLDKDLRAIVRFDKPLMKNFVQVHGDLLKFMNSMVSDN